MTVRAGGPVKLNVSDNDVDDVGRVAVVDIALVLVVVVLLEPDVVVNLADVVVALGATVDGVVPGGLVVVG